jgi:hypothetical protein
VIETIARRRLVASISRDEDRFPSFSNRTTMNLPVEIGREFF